MTATTNEPKIVCDELGFVKARFCPQCNEEYTTPPRIDDAGTEWWKCSKGHESCKPKSDLRKNLEAQAESDRAVEAEVQRIRDAPNQLEALMPHYNNLAVGDESVKKIIAVLLLGSKYGSSEMKVLILLKSDSGAGKSKIMQVMIIGYKAKAVGRLSAHALDYTNLTDYEVLSLKELGVMDDETKGTSPLKFLSSDDGGYTVEVTMRDEDSGRFTTAEYKIPAITVISSTTRFALEPQFERRAWSLSLDESPEQTERILRFYAKQGKQGYEKLARKRLLTDKEFSIEVISRFIEGFQPVEVVVPFPYTLMSKLGFSELRVRGDYNKLQVFCQLYGALNRKRLENLGGNFYALTPEVAVEALVIALKPMSAMLAKTDNRMKPLFAALKELREIETKYLDGGTPVEKEVKFDRKGSEITKQVRDKVAVKLHKDDRTLRDYFNFLGKGGYVSSDGKKPVTYTLLYDVAEIERKMIELSGLSAKTESADVLMDEMQKEAREFFSSALDKDSVRMGDKIPQPSPPMENKIPPIRTEKKSDCKLSDFSASFAKTEDENRRIEKSPITADLMNQVDNPTSRKMILLPRDMCSLKEEVKSPFTKTQFTDCLKKFGFESLDADRRFDDMEKQGDFCAVDIDKTQFKWTYD